MISSKSIVARRQALRLASSFPLVGLRSGTTSQFSQFHFISSQSSLLASKRYISTSNTLKIENKDVFPPPTLPKDHSIVSTHTSWIHPEFRYEEMEKIEVGHRPANTFSDKVALNAIRFLRWGMDTATGYRHPKETDGDDPKLAEKGKMTERKWLVRMIFLESVAGVPGMVAGMLRHLHSMRRLKRDNGWIESLLEEAFNERMHLLTFLKLYSPGLFMRTMILGAQGVFFNGFFVCYLISPRTCHRFVGYLEEEAVLTYTRAIKDLNDGKLPLWKHMQAPAIAVQYWDMPEGYRTMKDLLLYIRADEAKHREVNHTLGNLEAGDPNPFVSTFADPSKPHPRKDLKSVKSIGWSREEAL